MSISLRSERQVPRVVLGSFGKVGWRVDADIVLAVDDLTVQWRCSNILRVRDAKEVTELLEQE